MSVTFDGPNALILADPGITQIETESELYSSWKSWLTASDNAKFLPAFRTFGGDPLGGGLEAGAYFFLQNQNGWRIRPSEADHELTIKGNLYPEDPGQDMFVPTVGGFTVSVNLERSSLTQLVPPKEPPGIVRGQACRFLFHMRSKGDHVSPIAGQTVTCERWRDGDGWNPCDNQSVDEGGGSYSVLLSSSDTDARVLGLRFTSPAADPVPFTIITV